MLQTQNCVNNSASEVVDIYADIIAVFNVPVDTKLMRKFIYKFKRNKNTITRWSESFSFKHNADVIPTI